MRTRKTRRARRAAGEVAAEADGDAVGSAAVDDGGGGGDDNEGSEGGGGNDDNAGAGAGAGAVCGAGTLRYDLSSSGMDTESSDEETAHVHSASDSEDEEISTLV